MKRQLKLLVASVAIAVLASNSLGKAADKDIVDTAIAAGSFKTLAAALGAADLVDALKGEGPFTVFAPTDEAFAKLRAGTVETLLKPENKSKLAEILKYHVVAGRVYSEDALAAKKAATLQGANIHMSVSGDKAKINDANLLTTDLDASNGVIHVIDSVILPPEKKKVGAVEARKMIEQAVAHGSKTFNAGHHNACADLYMTTMREMVEYGDQMPEGVVTSMEHALAKAENTHCPTQRSWTLRHGLDHAYARMATLQ
jgi:transforming growth factor-beta-induced protein